MLAKFQNEDGSFDILAIFDVIFGLIRNFATLFLGGA